MTEVLRPGWLADDREWRAQLAALTPTDVEWFSRSWQLAAGPAPSQDLSWITTDGVR